MGKIGLLKALLNFLADKYAPLSCILMLSLEVSKDGVELTLVLVTSTYIAAVGNLEFLGFHSFCHEVFVITYHCIVLVQRLMFFDRQQPS